MGRDKAFVEVSGEQMVVRVAAALGDGGVAPIVAVGGDDCRLGELGIASIRDGWPGEGPLGGILTALRWCPLPRICIVACDLAMLTAATITALLSGDGGAGVVVAKSDRLEPLCALWPRDEATITTLSGLFAAGERSVRRALGSLGHTTIDVAAADLSNFNAPEDLR